MKKQKGYCYREGRWWKLRYWDTWVENGHLVHRQKSKILAAIESGEERLKRAPQWVLDLATAVLEPINKANYHPEMNVTVGDFVEKVYLPHVERQKRASTVAGYRRRWSSQLAARCRNYRLREFDTPAAQRALNEVARMDPQLKRSTLHHLRSLMSGIFRLAIQQGYLKGANPIREASIPNAPEGEETYAYTLEEVMAMLRVVPGIGFVAVAVAAFLGLRRSEIRGLRWEYYSAEQIKVMQSVWNGIVSEPKTRKSKALLPVIKPLRQILDQHRLRCGNPTDGYIFATIKGTPMSMNNVLNRLILPALNLCEVCGKGKEEHTLVDHKYERDASLPEWHGWHAFRRGLATNLHALGIDDETIQKLLRHAHVSVTQQCYIKTLPQQAVDAMRKLESLIDFDALCRDRAENCTTNEADAVAVM